MEIAEKVVDTNPIMAPPTFPIKAVISPMKSPENKPKIPKILAKDFLLT